ncbi:hypothetical protein, partial [Thermogutta sp.]|uniref:hypothetical protein n=1 Tax=Thermogutta sp. TaxID=1962930 RepID=UPI00322059AC
VASRAETGDVALFDDSADYIIGLAGVAKRKLFVIRRVLSARVVAAGVRSGACADLTDPQIKDFMPELGAFPCGQDHARIRHREPEHCHYALELIIRHWMRRCVGQRRILSRVYPRH